MNRVWKTVSGLSTGCPCQKGAKVVVLGGSGGIGQPLSLLLKKMQGISILALYDVATAVKGVAADLSHIDTPAQVVAYCGQEELPAALTNADIVVLTAGVARKPGMTRDDLFRINASIVSSLIKNVGKVCPNAFLLLVTNPVNSVVPIASEIMKRLNAYNPNKILGVTLLDGVRANTFLAKKLGVDVNKLTVRVIGGHAGITIIPLLSKVPGAEKLSEEDIKLLTKRIMFGGDEVVAAKGGAGSATLSMAHAGAKLVKSVLKAVHGEPVTECAFVASNLVPGLSYFASPVEISAKGITSIPPLPSLSPFEKQLLKDAIPDLKSQASKGTQFGQSYRLD